MGARLGPDSRVRERESPSAGELSRGVLPSAVRCLLLVELVVPVREPCGEIVRALSLSTLAIQSSFDHFASIEIL